MFICPICSNKSYSIVSPEMSGIYRCDGCSVLFCHPEKFGNINTGGKQVPTYPPIPGVVISEPIKLTRL
jgi:ribosomal protein L37AE/L43A